MNTQRFLKYNWPFFNITNERVHCSFIKESSFLQKKSNKKPKITFQFEKTSQIWLWNLTMNSQQLRCFQKIEYGSRLLFSHKWWDQITIGTIKIEKSKQFQCHESLDILKNLLDQTKELVELSDTVTFTSVKKLFGSFRFRWVSDPPPRTLQTFHWPSKKKECSKSRFDN